MKKKITNKIQFICMICVSLVCIFFTDINTFSFKISPTAQVILLGLYIFSVIYNIRKKSCFVAVIFIELILLSILSLYNIFS